MKSICPLVNMSCHGKNCAFWADNCLVVDALKGAALSAFLAIKDSKCGCKESAVEFLTQPVQKTEAVGHEIKRRGRPRKENIA